MDELNEDKKKVREGLLKVYGKFCEDNDAIPFFAFCWSEKGFAYWQPYRINVEIAIDTMEETLEIIKKGGAKMDVIIVKKD